jgi:hypothetical protein
MTVRKRSAKRVLSEVSIFGRTRLRPDRAIQMGQELNMAQLLHQHRCNKSQTLGLNITRSRRERFGSLPHTISVASAMSVKRLCRKQSCHPKPVSFTLYVHLPDASDLYWLVGNSRVAMSSTTPSEHDAKT